MSLMTIMMIFASSLSIVFTSITHPLAMGLILLIQTVVIAALMTFTLKTSWFSYILFLIFLGAMLVLFIYVATLAPNESLSLSYVMITVMILSLFLGALITPLDPFLLTHAVFIENAPSQMNLTATATTISLNPMYNLSSMKMTLFLILYLLLTLVVVVKITATHFGPLRLN
uniref:NADH-ubiquinone oxidoreductase chain 6 n=1 Tax=Typhlatya iliffei TaxID=390492 RepID=A0A1Z2R6Y4_TYPIL|nr:NADH dehydrogenase subunit 6 [Typhlatya iliffei]ASA39460.1 NADH dehydrogenase subunit 6 [Typhlatya iliffei]